MRAHNISHVCFLAPCHKWTLLLLLVGVDTCQLECTCRSQRGTSLDAMGKQSPSTPTYNSHKFWVQRPHKVPKLPACGEVEAIGMVVVVVKVDVNRDEPASDPCCLKNVSLVDGCQCFLV